MKLLVSVILAALADDHGAGHNDMGSMDALADVGHGDMGGMDDTSHGDMTNTDHGDMGGMDHGDMGSDMDHGSMDHGSMDHDETTHNMPYTTASPHHDMGL